MHTVLQHIAGQGAALLIAVAAKSQIVKRDASIRIGFAEGDIGAGLIKQEEADALQRLSGIRVDFQDGQAAGGICRLRDNDLEFCRGHLAVDVQRIGHDALFIGIVRSEEQQTRFAAVVQSLYSELIAFPCKGQGRGDRDGAAAILYVHAAGDAAADLKAAVAVVQVDIDRAGEGVPVLGQCD